jgi:hypothetical protein
LASFSSHDEDSVTYASSVSIQSVLPSTLLLQVCSHPTTLIFLQEALHHQLHDLLAALNRRSSSTPTADNNN